MRKRNQYLWLGLLTCLAALFALAAASVWKADKDGYESALTKLKVVCADVTSNDPERRVYEPIVGRYLGSKSYSAASTGHSASNNPYHKMVIRSDKLEKEVYFGAEREEFRKLMQDVGRIIGDQYMDWPNSPDTDFDVGICGHADERGHYVGRPETLVKLGVKHGY